MVHRTTPVEISTPECLRSCLDDSSGAEFAVTHVPELNIQAQSLVFARKRNGLLQPASVDHISNIVKGALTRAGMAPMTTRSVRGASPSKIVQLFPDLLPEALGLGRWTTKDVFNNHYQAPVKLVSSAKPPDSLKSNLQQILRWGFSPTPPPGVSVRDYMQGPGFWVGQSIQRVGKIQSFNEGVYIVGNANKELYHYELMEAISKARSI